MQDVAKPKDGLKTGAAVVAVLAVVGIVAAVVIGTHDRSPPTPPAPPPTKAQLAAQALAAQRTRPHTVLSIDGLRGEKSLEGNALLLSGTVVNTASFDIKDPTIRCLLTGASHTQIGQLIQTLEGVIPARGTKAFARFKVGDLGATPVGGFNCAVTAAEAP